MSCETVSEQENSRKTIPDLLGKIEILDIVQMEKETNQDKKGPLSRNDYLGDPSMISRYKDKRKNQVTTGAFFPLQRSALIQNTRPTQNLGSGDMPSISINSIMPFHNVDPKLLHCFLQLHQIGLRSTSRSNIFCGFAHFALGSI